MTASELYKQGRLQQAIDAQIAEVKANPANPDKRVFLFELASFAGDLDRARRQIDAVKYEEADRDVAVAGYRKLLDSEEKRRRLFRDGVQPRFLIEPPEHVKWRLEAVNRLRENRHAEAADLLNRANEGAAALKGTLNGKPFEGIRDADDLFGSVLEVIAHGEYFWLPLEQLDTLASNAPAFPRDLLWLPARVVMKEGEQGDVFLPAVYPGSHESAEEPIKLGRATDWKQAEGGPVLGMGARTFLVGEEASSMLEWRQLQMD